MFVLHCTWMFLSSCCCLICVPLYCIYGNKLQSSRTSARLWSCLCSGRIPPWVSSAPLNVLEDKALLCSPSGDGTISSVRASVLLFFLCSCSQSPGLARLRNSVDHTLGICFSLLFAGKQTYI